MELEKARPGFKPLAFFKGTLAEAEKVDAVELAQAVKSYGLSVSVKPNRAEELKCELLSHMRELESSYPHTRTCKVSEARLGGKRVLVAFERFPKSGRFLVSQTGVTHGVTGRYDDPFDALKQILEQGFFSSRAPNVDANFGTSASRRSRMEISSYWAAKSQARKVHGDGYVIELMKPLSSSASFGDTDYVPRAPGTSITKVHVLLKRGLSEEEATARKAFYRSALKGWPVRFVREH